MLKEYSFNLSFMVAYPKNDCVSNTDFHFESQTFTTLAYSYEEARTTAVIHAHEILKYFYEPMGAFAYMRVRKGKKFSKIRTY